MALPTAQQVSAAADLHRRVGAMLDR